MSALVIVDSSVFFHIVEIPENTANSQRSEVLLEFRERAKAGDIFLLPIATIIETGNLVAKRGHAQERRVVAGRYVDRVSHALAGESPFRPTRFFARNELAAWLIDFPERAMEGKGMGDVSLIAEWERQKSLNPKRRVRIWAHDRRDLAGYDTNPE